MIVEDLKRSILQKAFEGKLVDNSMKKNEYSSIKSNKGLYEVPDTWCSDQLYSVCEGNIYTGNSIPEITKKNNYMGLEKGYNYIATKDLCLDHTFNYQNGVKIPYESNNFKYANEGDILMCIEGGSAGKKIGLLKETVCYGNKLCKFSSKLVVPKFLYYYLQSPQFLNYFNCNLNGIIGGVNLSKIKKTKIFYPTFDEQQRIVDKIEELFAKLDEIKPIEEELKELKNNFSGEIKKSIMQDAISGKLSKQISTENTNEIMNGLKTSNVDIFPFPLPYNWRWIKFGELVDFNIGKTPPRSDSNFWNGQYSWASISDMPENGIINETKESVTDSAFENIFRKNISKKGTLLMSFKLTVGRCSILGIDSFHNEGIISIYPKYNSEILKIYLFKILPYITKFGDTKGAIKGKTLNSKSLHSLLIPLPPIEEQRRIIEKLDQLLPLCDEIEKLVN